MITTSDLVMPAAGNPVAVGTAAATPAFPPLRPKARPADDPEWNRRRVSIWPVAAALAASVACIVAIGTHALGGGFSSPASLLAARPDRTLRQPSPSQAQRNPLPEAELQKLTDKLVAGEQDRQRLETRLARIEAMLGETTGSISRPAERMRLAQAELPGMPVQPMPVQPVPVQTLPAPSSSFAAPPQALLPANAPFGADLGLVRSLSAARAKWARLQSSAGDPIVGLQNLGARLVITEGIGDTTQIRLLIGPFPDRGAAGRYCQSIQSGPAECRPASFQGQPL